jgi:hypothetical protein
MRAGNISALNSQGSDISSPTEKHVQTASFSSPFFFFTFFSSPQPTTANSLSREPSTSPSRMTSDSSPQIFIIGAGLGGLTMAILLERAGLNYLVFEKSHQGTQALGSATNLGPNVLPLFEQLGLYEKLEAISKPSSTVYIYNESMEQIGNIDYNEYLPQYVVLHPRMREKCRVETCGPQVLTTVVLYPFPPLDADMYRVQWQDQTFINSC